VYVATCFHDPGTSCGPEHHFVAPKSQWDLARWQAMCDPLSGYLAA
jgi:hypothetical protein